MAEITATHVRDENIRYLCTYCTVHTLLLYVRVLYGKIKYGRVSLNPAKVTLFSKPRFACGKFSPIVPRHQADHYQYTDAALRCFQQADMGAQVRPDEPGEKAHRPRPNYYKVPLRYCIWQKCDLFCRGLTGPCDDSGRRYC